MSITMSLSRNNKQKDEVYEGNQMQILQFFALFKTVTKKERSNCIEHCKLTYIWNIYHLLVTVKMKAT